MSCLLLILDVRIAPVSPVPWGALIVLLVIVFVLAVALVAGLVVLLIWLKRRRIKHAWLSREPPDFARFDDIGRS